MIGRLAFALPALLLLRADMFPDASNAAQPQAINNLAKATGTYFAPAYGNCTWDATHDVAPCVNAAIAAAGAANSGGTSGGVVLVPAAEMGLLSSIVLIDQVQLRGAGVSAGGRSSSDFKWLGNGAVGVAGGSMVKIGSSAGSVNTNGSGIQDIAFDGMGLAAMGVEAWSASYGFYQRVVVSNVTGIGWLIDQVGSPGGGINPNSHLNQYYAIDINLTTPEAINAKGLVFGQTNTTYDASENTFVALHVSHQNGTGIEIGSADSNTFVNIWSQAAGVGTTGIGLHFKGSDTNDVTRGFGNFIYNIAAGNGAHPLGGIVADPGTMVSPTDNYIMGVKTGDGEPTPIDNTETGRGLIFCTDRGWCNGRVRQRNVTSTSVNITNAESNETFTTNGAPFAQTANLRPALGDSTRHCFFQTDQRWTIQPDGTDTITVGNRTGAAGAALVSGIVRGSSACLVATQTGNWTAQSLTGAWVLGGVTITAGTPSSSLDTGLAGITDPALTSSTSIVMAGMRLASGGTAIQFTPTTSGKFRFRVQGTLKNSIAGNGVATQLYYGTGAAPAAGAALTGTACTSQQAWSKVTDAAASYPISLECIVSGTAGTTYWLDAGFRAVTGGNANLATLQVTANE